MEIAKINSSTVKSDGPRRQKVSSFVYG